MTTFLSRWFLLLVAFDGMKKSDLVEVAGYLGMKNFELPILGDLADVVLMAPLAPLISVC